MNVTRMTWLWPLVIGALIAGCQPTPKLRGPPISGLGLCGPMDSSATVLRDGLVRVVTSGDSVYARMRAMVPMPTLVADSVVLVDDAQTCARAAEAFALVQGPPSPTFQSIYLFRLGHAYAIQRPGGQPGTVVAVMDPRFRVLGMWGL